MKQSEQDKNQSPCRVYIILARSAPVGIVFRRGPSDWVQALKWDTSSDNFEPGQWFKGRIYERRCDLSPDGSLLVYFSSKIEARTIQDQEYTYAWTAVSKPPYLTALALWPKGDCWHGGGLFESKRRLWLNHHPAAAVPHPRHLPKGLKVTANPNASGEDYPIWSRRMARDGWECIQEGVYPFSWGQDWRTEDKQIWQKRHPDGRQYLQQVLEEINFQSPGASGGYVESFWLALPDETPLKIDNARWADWDQNGRLVFARDGCIFAGSVQAGQVVGKQLIDLNPNKPYTLEAPGWAQRW